MSVSHGEGSITNNAAFDLTFDPTFEIVGLASEVGNPSTVKRKQFSSIHISPATNVLSQGTYRTYDEDKYYSDIYSRLNFSAPAPNFSYSPVPLVGEQWLHDFSKTYMAIGVSGGQFSSEYFGTLGGVIEAAELLESNCSIQKPIATFSYIPGTGAPFTYNFDGSASYSFSNSDIVKYEWLVDGFFYFVGSRPIYTFLSEGFHTVQLTVTDAEGNISDPLITLVQASSVLPVARFDFVSHANSLVDPNPMRYDFDGSMSTSSNELVTFNWLIDGLYFYTGSKPTVDFLEEGYHTVQLTVTDSENSMSEPYLGEVYVTNLAPIAEFVSTGRGLTVGFDAKSSSDDGEIVSYEWNFGDGGSGSGLETSHVYNAEGMYSVTLTVRDNNGKVSDSTHTVLVEVRCDGQEGELIGNVFVSKNAIFDTTGSISGKVDLCDSASLTGNVSIFGNSKITIAGTAQVSGDAFIQNAAGSKIIIDGNSIIRGSVRVFSRYALNITDDTIIEEGARVQVSFTGGFGSDGEITLEGGTHLKGDSFVETVAFGGYRASIYIKDTTILGQVSAHAFSSNASVSVEGAFELCEAGSVIATDESKVINTVPQECVVNPLP